MIIPRIGSRCLDRAQVRLCVLNSRCCCVCARDALPRESTKTRPMDCKRNRDHDMALFRNTPTSPGMDCAVKHKLAPRAHNLGEFWHRPRYRLGSVAPRCKLFPPQSNAFCPQGFCPPRCAMRHSARRGCQLAQASRRRPNLLNLLAAGCFCSGARGRKWRLTCAPCRINHVSAGPSWDELGFCRGIPGRKCTLPK